MISAQQQLSTYKSVHLSRKNIATHLIGVPAIIWSIALLMSLYSWSFSLFEQVVNLSVAKVFFAGVMFYYITLYWSGKKYQLY